MPARHFFATILSMDKKTLPNDIVLEEARTLLDEGREVCITPKGNSMLPFIRGDRDTVTLKRQQEVNVGDIVLARLPSGQYVMHRVIRRDGLSLTLMGDGNIRGTESCTAGDIIGTVVLINNRKPGDGALWRRLKPVRRIILAIYRRII